MSPDPGHATLSRLITPGLLPAAFERQPATDPARMKPSAPIRLLAATNNARGDLFTRLCDDLFFAMGYGDLRHDAPKPGREIDVQGQHRREARRLVAECKAHAEPIGGRDVNTFCGALLRERNRHRPTPVVGYFVSLSGFRGTAQEQEEEMPANERIVMLDGHAIVAELTAAHILIDEAGAVERAGRCAAHAGLADQVVLDGTELLGHELGYVWAVFYARDKARTHVALIHADGTPLAEPVARQVMDADRACGGHLGALAYYGAMSLLAEQEMRSQLAESRIVDMVRVLERSLVSSDPIEEASSVRGNSDRARRTRRAACKARDRASTFGYFERRATQLAGMHRVFWRQEWVFPNAARAAFQYAMLLSLARWPTDERLADVGLQIRDALASLLSLDDPPLALAASFALGLAGHHSASPLPPTRGTMLALFRLWREAGSPKVRWYAAWAFAAQPLLSRDTFAPGDWGECDAWFDEEPDDRPYGEARLVLAWYRRAPWSDEALVDKVDELPVNLGASRLPDMLATLGEPGRRALERYRRSMTPTRNFPDA